MNQKRGERICSKIYMHFTDEEEYVSIITKCISNQASNASDTPCSFCFLMSLWEAILTLLRSISFCNYYCNFTFHFSSNLLFLTSRILDAVELFCKISVRESKGETFNVVRKECQHQPFKGRTQTFVTTRTEGIQFLKECVFSWKRECV